MNTQLPDNVFVFTKATVHDLLNKERLSKDARTGATDIWYYEDKEGKILMIADVVPNGKMSNEDATFMIMHLPSMDMAYGANYNDVRRKFYEETSYHISLAGYAEPTYKNILWCIYSEGFVTLGYWDKDTVQSWMEKYVEDGEMTKKKATITPNFWWHLVHKHDADTMDLPSYEYQSESMSVAIEEDVVEALTTEWNHSQDCPK